MVKSMSLVTPCCTVLPLMSRWNLIACRLRNFSFSTHSPMAAEPSNPLNKSHGIPLSRIGFCMSLAVKSIPTVTAS